MSSTGRPQTARTSAAFRRMKREREATVAAGGIGGHVPEEVVDSAGVPYVVKQSRSESSSSEPWCPSTKLALKLFLTVRLSAAVWSTVADCDETFNYWEPMHFLLYGKGFQTWEYSPKYGLRSYLYILLHLLPAWLYDRIVSPHRMYVFYFVRCLLGCACAASETYFVRGVRREYGPNVARLALAFLLTSAGVFVASTAFLPSSSSMYLTLLSYGAWYNGDLELAVLFTAMSFFLSWPFAALVGLPIALDIVFRRKRVVFFIRWCVISTVTILVPQIFLDSSFYGRIVAAPFNIIAYNMLTSHGPDLYGTEPWHFYILNGILNFNVVFLLSLVAWPVQALCHALLPNAASASGSSSDAGKWYLNTSALFLWLAVFVLQPHKEERFLYPVYPLVALAAACAVDALQKIYFRLLVTRQFRHYLEHTNWMAVATVAVALAGGASRGLALYYNYGAPMNTWMHVSHLPFSTPDKFNRSNPVNVCMGKEWHRFPSSFFLPADNWEMRFLRSEFRGQLPQPFLRDREDATAVVRDNFNDLNREEEDRYLAAGADGCHFIVDLERPGAETELEPDYARDEDQWRVVSEMPFLDAAATPRLWRSFYVPYFGPKNSVYTRYLLLENLRPVVTEVEPVEPEDKPDTEERKSKKNIRHL